MINLRPAGAEAVLPVAAMIPDVIRTWAERTPDAPAILAPGRPPLGFRGLLGQIEATAAALAAAGVGLGDRVALALDEGPELAAALLGVPAAAAAVPLDPGSTAAEFGAVIERLVPAAVLVSAGSPTAARAAAAGYGIPVVELVPTTGAAGTFSLAHGVHPRPGHRRIATAGPDDTAYLLTTSGTTGRPRWAPLSHANVLASADGVRAAQRLTAADRCLNLMRMFHIAFIGNLVSSLAAGASVVCPPGFDGPRFFAWLDEFRPTWYMAPPAVHRAVLDRAAGHAETIARVPLRFTRSGSAPLSPADEARLEATFGAPVTQGYGVTEASPSITAVPLPPATRKSGSVGVTTGSEIAIRGERGELLPPGVVGEVVVRGPNVIRGYLDDPAADAEAFTAGGWFRTGDLGSLDEDGFLFLAGRVKEVINRGGQKVAPQEVEAALLAHPAVVEAVAFALPDARLGEAVGAAVVLQPGRGVGEGGLRAFAAERLSAYKAPSRVVVLDRLPKGPTGKPRRVGLAAELGLVEESEGPPGSAARGGLAPRTALEARVADVWSSVLGVDRIGVEDDFLALGGDSLLATRVVARLGAELGLDLAAAAFFDAPTVGAMAVIVEDALLHSVERAPESAGGGS